MDRDNNEQYAIEKQLKRNHCCPVKQNLTPNPLETGVY
jgi:hypothetical protein